MAESSADIVRRFCAAWAENDLETIIGAFTDDAVYHNIPLEPLHGREAIAEFITGFLGTMTHMEFRMLNLVADGDLVMTERVDVLGFPGNAIDLPVMGVFEVRDGLIAAWRDYYDQSVFAGLVPPA